MTSKWLGRLNEINQSYGRGVAKVAKIESLGALLIMLLWIGSAWAFAWYAHIIGPWVDNLFGLDPHDADSLAKIQWRRIWSSIVCLPMIVVSLVLYLLNVRDRRQGRTSSLATSFRLLDKNSLGVVEAAARMSPEVPLPVMPAAVAEGCDESTRKSEAPQQLTSLLIKASGEESREFGNARMEIKGGQATLTIKEKSE